MNTGSSHESHEYWESFTSAALEKTFRASEADSLLETLV